MTAVAEKPKPKTKSAAFDLSSIVPGAKAEAPRPLGAKFSILIHAEKGMGKTSLLGSAADVADLAPILVIAAEDGTSVLADQYDESELQVVVPESYEQAKAIISAFVNGKLPYKTLGVDTLYKLQQMMKRESSLGGYDLWGYVGEETELIVNSLHECPGNVIFTTHAERKEDEAGRTLWLPQFVGKQAYREALKPLDEVYFLAVKEIEGEAVHVLQTRQNGRALASTRAPRMEAFIPSPTMSEVYAQFTRKADAE